MSRVRVGFLAVVWRLGLGWDHRIGDKLGTENGSEGFAEDVPRILRFVGTQRYRGGIPVAVRFPERR